MFIQTEATPNPTTLKFLPGRVVMEKETAFFKNESECMNSPLAKRLFTVEGVVSVFLVSDFITITKKDNLDWQTLKPMVLGAIVDHYNAGDKVIIKSKTTTKNKEKISSSGLDDSNDDIIKQIKELLDTRIRPAVAMDGGDIVFQNFEKGVVYLNMQGACAGCPSSTATLKAGIENMLKHYIPEVKEVRPVDA